VGENKADLCLLPADRFQQVCGDGRRSGGYTQGGNGREAGGAGGTAAEEVSPGKMARRFVRVGFVRHRIAPSDNLLLAK
jgi:hypothetical protein